VSATACDTFLTALERVREQHQLCVYGHVIMPEHVHLLMDEPEYGALAQTIPEAGASYEKGLA
jgi:putative transposase